jgi:DNA-directed RNA polymerase specialized sigma24 family protein
MRVSVPTIAEVVEQSRCVTDALSALPKRRRSILVLQGRDALTYSQIAERLGLTKRQVNREVSAGHCELRLALAGVERQ